MTLKFQKEVKKADIKPVSINGKYKGTNNNYER